ncbi:MULTISPECIES: glycosyltransferase [Bacillus]|uniref:glycosyltransferase n=1 Tax=Bacillus TaxID=1386 RepID=UPI000B8BDA26|nr:MULTISPECIES: glycosyltransferase [Bacillus amyloliquefaciens group]ASP25907.1 glycosyltransferase [Bacillus velezensis]ATO10673.1 glycosyltransferase [Bacillus velezensis]AZI46623.1 glycosyltransferase [Bacillus velezensis]MBG9463644.1 glycosyltransferase [Bacillus amyloliquefaciens]MBW7976229.1 glycosyltransferase [Bacillus velezensis]
MSGNAECKLTLCMIVKNEERYISRCLSSVQDIADEIVIADTGSQDNTKDICKSFQARVFDFEWENDFAKARNYALQHAEGDWILVLDADEELDQETGRFLTSLLHDGLPSRGLLKIINYTGKQLDENEAFESMQPRLFRNHKGLLYQGRIHENISAPNEEENNAFFTLPCVIHHYGYLEQEEKIKQKHKRNISILNEELSEENPDPWLVYHLASECYRIKDYEKALHLVNGSIFQFLSEKRMPPSLLYYLKYTILLELKRYEEAEQGIEKVLKLYPDYSNLHYYKGLVLYHLEKYRAAIKAFENGTQVEGENADHLMLKGAADFRAFYYMAKCHSALNHDMTAIAYAKKSVKFNPQFKPAKELLSQLKKDQRTNA